MDVNELVRSTGKVLSDTKAEKLIRLDKAYWRLNKAVIVKADRKVGKS